MPHLSDNERASWLRLIRTENIGPVTFHNLIARYKSAEAALEALPGLASKAGRKRAAAPPSKVAAAVEMARADEIGARLVFYAEPDYPAPLRALPDAPPALYVRGHTSLFDRPAIAIVGARNASGAGRKIARSFATSLGEEGYVVVSGLASGIDGAAHAASLATGTIAVVAGGVDVVYPRDHEELTQRIAAQGAIVSERPPGAEPTARDFPRRNRLVTGLSLGVVIIEAALRSGTLISARLAAEQGREVFVVPGSPLDPRSLGANNLIRDGATLVNDAADVIEGLQGLCGAAQEPADLFDWADGPHGFDDDGVARVLSAVRDMLSYTPLHRDDIIRETGAPTAAILDALMTLVVAGEAEEAPGGRFVKSAQ